MPPHCYPADPDFGTNRHAEQHVWDALRDQLPDEAVLLHSVWMVKDGKDLEADLIVAWPGVGVAVIEVKGGQVSCVDGEWSQLSLGAVQPHSILDPVTQARDCKYALRDYLNRRCRETRGTRLAHLVAFPFSHIGSEGPHAGCPRDMVIAWNDLGRTAERVRDAIDQYGVGRAPLIEGLECLVDALVGQMSSQTSLLTAAAEIEAHVDVLTCEQARALAQTISRQRRLQVVGSAGTGKTWLALEQARLLAARGERVALVCYSRGLARFLTQVTAQWPRRSQPAYVGIFHALPLRWGAELPPPENSEDAPTYYEERLPAQMAALAASLDDQEKFDTIIVDEAQDFSAAWWPPALACLRDQDNGGLHVYLDEGQRVFEWGGDVPIQLPPIVLHKNVRNTKRIAQMFGSLAPEQAKYLDIKGPPVRYIPCSSQEAIHEADAQVDLLIDEGWQPGQIALLVTGKRHPFHQEVLGHHGVDGYWDSFFSGNEVFYGHVLGFKGLERATVVLAVNGMRDETRGREYLYVGLSRARTRLVVCGDLVQMAVAGGEGLRRRLKACMLDAHPR